MARLEVFDGQEKIREVRLSQEKLTLGRDPSCEVALEDVSVSRRHMEIEPTGGFYVVRDLGSTNGTFVNDMLVRMHLLTHGDLVRVGRFVLRVDARPEPDEDSTRVRIEASSSPDSDEIDDETQRDIPPPAERPRDPRFELFKNLRTAVGFVQGTEELFRRALDFLILTLDVDRASFLVVDDADPGDLRDVLRRVRSVAARTRTQAKAGGQAILIDDGTLRRALRRTDPLVCRIPDDEREALAMIAPLLDRGNVLGGIYVDRSSTRQPFDESVRGLFDAICQQLATSYVNARLLDDLFIERGKVQAIFSSLSDGVLVADDQFRVTEANVAATLLLGLEGRNPLGKPLSALLDEFMLDAPFSRVTQQAREGGAVLFAEREAPHVPSVADGASSLSIQIVPCPRHRDTSGFVITLRDVSEDRRRDVLRAEFVRSAAGRLRVPLHEVQANLSLVRKAAPPGDARAAALAAAANRAADVEALLEAFIGNFVVDDARIGRFGRRGRAKPSELISWAAEAAADAITLRGVKLVRRGEESLPRIEVEIGRFVRALTCVLEWLVDAGTQNGTITIDASLEEDDLEWRFVTPSGVEVGQEPSPAALHREIVRLVVSEHGGSVDFDVETESAELRTVTIALPRSRLHLTEGRSREVAPQEAQHVG